MIRTNVKSVLFSFLFLLVVFQQAPGQSSTNGSDIRSRMHHTNAIIIIAPHPDDEVLGFAGIIYDALKMGKTVKVVLLTNGEGYGSACYFWKNGCPAEDSNCLGTGCSPSDLEKFGKVRIEESKRALKQLGLNSEHLITLSYPDGFIGDMFRYPDSVFTSVTGNNISATGKKFTGKNLIDDLKTIFKTYTEEIVFSTHIKDQHPDHGLLAAFIQQARNELISENILFPTYWGVIHQPGWGDNNSWPLPSCSREYRKGEAMKTREERYCPSQVLYPPDAMKEVPERYFMDPDLWKSKDGEKPAMRKAIDEYRTQSGLITISDSLPRKGYEGWMDRNGFLLSFVKINHLFWEAPYPVITSSTKNPDQQGSLFPFPVIKQDGLQANGFEGNCSLQRIINSQTILRIGSGLESGRAWYYAGPVFQDSISVTLRWKHNSRYPGIKTLEIYNWKNSDWEVITNLNDNTEEWKNLHLNTAIDASRLGPLHQVIISVNCNKNASLDLESLSIE